MIHHHEYEGRTEALEAGKLLRAHGITFDVVYTRYLQIFVFKFSVLLCHSRICHVTNFSVINTVFTVGNTYTVTVEFNVINEILLTL